MSVGASRTGRGLAGLIVLMSVFLAGCGSDGGPASGTAPEPEEPSIATTLIVETPGGGSAGDGGMRVTPAGSAFPEPVRLRVEDQRGNPVAGHPIEATIVAGEGWVTTPTPTTNARGEAAVTWYAGSDPKESEQRLGLRAGAAPALVAEVTGRTVPPEVGVRLTGHRDFVEYTPGTLPLVITATHGGTLLPADLPDRTWGTLVRDLATDTLALLMADSLEALSGERPHLIRVHLHRRSPRPGRRGAGRTRPGGSLESPGDDLLDGTDAVAGGEGAGFPG